MNSKRDEAGDDLKRLLDESSRGEGVSQVYSSAQDLIQDLRRG